MPISKVTYNGTPLIDLTSDTVTPSDLTEGVTAHDAAGNLIVGTAVRNDYDVYGETTERDSSKPTYGLT